MSEKSYRLLEDVTDQIRLDGLPRVVLGEDQDGSRQQHVVFLEGESVRSTLASEWVGPLPTNPTPQQIIDAIAAREQARVQARLDAQALRQQVVQIAQSSVGIRFDQLTGNQLRAIVSIILWERGVLDKSGVVRPLEEWVRRE